MNLPGYPVFMNLPALPVFGALVGIILFSTPLLAGSPDYGNQMMQKQYIADTVQTVKEQAVPRGELIKELVLDIIEDIGYTKALLWLAMLPLLGLAGVVFGFLKLFRKKA